ncbi:hypothetical protein DPMN_001768 [Dreissena polymorpha]|uniref:Lipoxygenase domain-containing protein n=1 Tax=Dreissena polymorpha TaxID=45954 RepID=A0A9D4RT83_DREPO|nr:hypothetical protein DPMN_001768 [Dreissena polymorpha]
MITIGTNGVAELIKRYRPKRRMNVEGTLSEDLKARGVYDHVVVPHYPFRDDALLTFNAILKYVTSYVNLYYPSDDILSKDMEIQIWRRELDTPIEQGGLGVPGVPGEGGKFTSRDQLIQVVTSIIYTCSVGHAAANFKQYDEYAFPLNYPSLLLGKPPSNKTERSEKDIMQAIDRSRHLDVMVIVNILSERSTMALGNFEVNYINDPKAFEVVNAFRKELKLASETISERNKVRDVPFDWLDPGKIPNSISI